MRRALQIAGLFFLFLIFMCITVNNRPIFNHIYGVISPGTQFAQDGIENGFAYIGGKTRHYSRKLFVNSVPRVKDDIKSKLAAPKRKMEEPLEAIPEDDKEQLDELIKSH
ncbi:MAG: hypothetical protein AB7I27_07755 [Bacteriovoracaceae bacterium]